MSNTIPFSKIKPGATLLIWSTRGTTLAVQISRVFDDGNGPGTQSVLEGRVTGFGGSAHRFDFNKPVTLKLADLGGKMGLGLAPEFSRASLNAISTDCAVLFVQDGVAVGMLQVAEVGIQS